MKKSNEKKAMKEYLIAVTECVQRWEYIEMYAGKAQVFALFLVFLKCMDDIYARKEGRKSFFEMIDRQLHTSEMMHANDDLWSFFDAISRTWTCDTKIVELFIKRINMQEIPKSFDYLLDILEQIDFSEEERVNELVDAVLLLYGDPYTNFEICKRDGYTGLVPVFLAKEVLKDFEDCDIYGFSCGTGGLLGMACETNTRIYGQESDVEKAMVAFIILRLISINKSECYFRIELGDVLEHPITMDMRDIKFDRILAAPPIGRRKIIADKLLTLGAGEEFMFPRSNTDSGAWTYVRHIMKKLKADGKAVMITGVSELSREGTSKKDREQLLDYGAIDAIIQLPAESSMGTNLCMIILGTASSRRTIYVLDMDGPEARKLLTNEWYLAEECITNCKEIAKIINEKIEIKGVGKNISYQDIIDHGVNLVPTVYLRSLDELICGQEDLEELFEKEYGLDRLYDEASRAFRDAVEDYRDMKKN